MSPISDCLCPGRNCPLHPMRLEMAGHIGWSPELRRVREMLAASEEKAADLREDVETLCAARDYDRGLLAKAHRVLGLVESEHALRPNYDAPGGLGDDVRALLAEMERGGR